MVSVIASGLSSPGTLCGFHGRDTFLSQYLSPPGSTHGYWQTYSGVGNPVID